MKQRSCGGAGASAAPSDDLLGPWTTEALTAGYSGRGDGSPTWDGDPSFWGSDPSSWGGDPAQFPYLLFFFCLILGLSCLPTFPEGCQDAEGLHVGQSPDVSLVLPFEKPRPPDSQVHEGDISLSSVPKAGWTPGLILQGVLVPPVHPSAPEGQQQSWDPTWALGNLLPSGSATSQN